MTPAGQEELNMGKDASWKKYFSDKRRYADIINGIGCEGMQLVKDTDLSDADGQTNEGKSKDLLCKSAFGINFALIGIENQEKIDYSFPLRNMSYDVAEYEKQAAKIRKEVRDNPVGLKAGEYMYGFRKMDNLKPVITFVLYSGVERWDGATSLKEMLDFTDIPDVLRDMTSDYKVNIIEIRQLEHTEVFQTDVRQVFDFIRYSENKNKLKQLVDADEYYQHMDEDAFEVVSLYLNSAELTRAENFRREDGRVNMCTAIREMIEDGRQEGLAEGIREGESLFATLMKHLFADGRMEDARLATENEEARKRFYCEYGMIDN